jgi:hypothetical protein
MADPATRVSPRFRKDVEKISKDKVGGDIVRHFRKEFAPEAVATIRSKNLSSRYVIIKKSMAKKAKKK